MCGPASLFILSSGVSLLCSFSVDFAENKTAQGNHQCSLLQVTTLLTRVIDQTSSGINNRQSVCPEKKDCSCPYKVVIIISAGLSQRRNCDTKEDADE